MIPLLSDLHLDDQRLSREHADYSRLGATLTLNLSVTDIGVVLSLLMDHGYEVEVNLSAPITGETT